MTEMLKVQLNKERVMFASRDDLRQAMLEYSQCPEETAGALDKLFDQHIQTLINERAWCEDKFACETYASRTTLRGFLWKLLLDVKEVDSESYRRIVEESGPSSVYEKIKSDSFRTLATDKKFQDIVSATQIERLLNAFASHSKNTRMSYVQGMNVLSAPFLFVMPEVEAYYAFSNFITTKCPLYVLPTLDGAHCGVKLLDTCLKIIDPQLYHYLQSKSLSADIYAFAPVLTFLASQPPLDEVLKLWDFYMAFGVHMNILCVLAQLISIRNALLSSQSPMKLLQKLPDLQARSLTRMAMRFSTQLSVELYDLLVRHPYDDQVAQHFKKGTDNKENSPHPSRNIL